MVFKFKCDKSRRSCYTLDAVSKLMSPAKLFTSKFINVSNLGHAFFLVFVKLS